MEKIEGRIPGIVQKIIQEIIAYAFGQMNLRTPVDTDFLRESIDVKFPSMLEGFVTPTADYGIWVELKWPKLGRVYSSHARVPSRIGYVADTYGDVKLRAQGIAEDVINQELS